MGRTAPIRVRPTYGFGARSDYGRRGLACSGLRERGYGSTISPKWGTWPAEAASYDSIVRRRLAPLFLASMLALAVATVALADREQIHITAEGQAAARAALPRQADFGIGWVGKSYKPTLNADMQCAGFDPKQSDLVLNGMAAVRFSHPGIQIETVAQVLQTSKMVGLDWQRTVETPAVLPCMRTMIAKTLPTGATIASLKRLAFPKVATYTDAFRMLIDVSANGTTVRMFADIVLVGRGRTEITMTTVAPLAADVAVRAAEGRLAQLAARRATA